MAQGTAAHNEPHKISSEDKMVRVNTLLASVISIALLSMAVCAFGESAMSDQLLTAGSTNADSASRGGVQAAMSVVRVGCGISEGTGFVHKSGWIVTAAHVVRPCGSAFRVQTVSGQNLSVKEVKRDDLLDLAIVSTDPKPETGSTLPISAKTLFSLGSKVSTWGFPSGYNGHVPLLSVGYLAGAIPVKNEFGVSPPQWVVNGAFNLGNSGGPVISIEDGAVIGVVSSKLAPIPKDLEISLNALSTNRYGIIYKREHADGKTENLSEGQIVAEILNHLRKQVQLVVGYAVSVRELRQFLEKQEIEP
jgi:S1-C subfamily serine protease